MFIDTVTRQTAKAVCLTHIVVVVLLNIELSTELKIKIQRIIGKRTKTKSEAILTAPSLEILNVLVYYYTQLLI